MKALKPSKPSRFACSLLAATIMAACGTASSDDKAKEGEGKEGFEVVMSGDSVQFEIAAPSDNQGAALTDIEAQPKPMPTEEPSMPSMPPAPSDRISIRCKGDVVKIQNLMDEEDIPKPADLFRIGLETIKGNDASYESTEFQYNCGNGGAVVTITGLTTGAKYAIDAQYWQGGVLTHKGKTSYFALGADGTAAVKLLMTKVEPPKKGKAKVDVIFEDEDDKPAICPMSDHACDSQFEPVLCTATAVPLDGREIALMIGPVKGSNYCEAKKELSHQACEQKAKLIDIQCEPLK